MTPMAPARTKIAAVSKRLHLENGRNGIIAQSTTTGAMIEVPAASANHHVAQVTTESTTLTPLARIKPPAAMAELISAVGTKQMSCKRLATVRPAIDQPCPD